jgi:hypothetical protein
MSEFEDGPLEKVQDLWVDGDRLVVAGPADAGSGHPLVNGAVLFDIGDPSDPVQLDAHETSFPIHNTGFDDGVIYLTANGSRGNPVVLLSTENDELAELSRWSLLDHDEEWAGTSAILYNLHDVVVQDGLAYLLYWNAGTWILDVSDPAAPRYVGHIEAYDPSDLADIDRNSPEFLPTFRGPPGNHHAGALSDDGSLFALGKEAWEVEQSNGEVVGGPGGIELWDVSDPANPTKLAAIEPPESADNTFSGGQFTTAHNFDIAGDRLYTAWYYGGVKRHDIGDPTDPVERTWWRAPSEATFWTAQAVPDRDFFVGSSTDYGTNEGALYTFPDRAGQQTNPPTLQSGADGRTDGTSGSSTGETDDTDETDQEHEDDGTPGFGIGAVGLGLGLGVLRLLSRSDESDRSPVWTARTVTDD